MKYKCKYMKKKFRFFLEFLIIIFWVSFPLWARYILNNPLIFPQDGNQIAWLQFCATYYGAIASFVMIYYTARTLKNNKEQLNEMKRQWQEEHRPEIIAYLVAHENFLHLCVKNISIITVKNIRISINHISDKKDFLFPKQAIENINNAIFSIEPSGCRYINTYVYANYNTTEDDYLGLRFTFDDNNEYNVNLPFKVASYVTDDLNEKKFSSDIHQISVELQKIERKMK